MSKRKRIVHFQTRPAVALCGMRHAPKMVVMVEATTCPQCLAALPAFDHVARSQHSVKCEVRGYRLEVTGSCVVLSDATHVLATGSWRRGGYVAWPRGLEALVVLQRLDDIDAALRLLVPAAAGSLPADTGALTPGMFGS